MATNISRHPSRPRSCGGTEAAPRRTAPGRSGKLAARGRPPFAEEMGHLRQAYSASEQQQLYRITPPFYVLIGALLAVLTIVTAALVAAGKRNPFLLISFFLRLPCRACSSSQPTPALASLDTAWACGHLSLRRFCLQLSIWPDWHGSGGIQISAGGGCSRKQLG